MKTKQLFISLMLFCLLPLASWAEVYTDPATGVNYYYQVGIAASSVTKSPSVSGDIEILSHFTVDGSTYRVENIDKEAFRDCSNLTNVTIPNSVVNIGIGAFLRSGLTSITIPNSVTNIGSGAFEECHGLTSVIIPNGVTTISAGAFYACAGLTSITLPNSLIKIDRDAFSYCKALTEIYSYIENPFKVNCWFQVDLKKIQLYVPKGTMDKYQATGGWHEFTNIAEMGEGETPAGNIRFADAEVKRICVENWDTNGDGMLGYDEAAAVKDLGDVFKGNNIIKTFDEFQYFTGIETINRQTFEYCINLSSIKFPNSIKHILLQAFACTGLTSISIPKSVIAIEPVVFEACEKLASITVEEGNKVYDSRDNCNAIIDTEYNSLIVGCKNTIIPASVKSISEGAFDGCTGLTSIEIPSTVKYIGAAAFAGCGLTSIIIPKSVSNIGEVAFANCLNLSSIVVEEGNTAYDSRDNCNAIIYTKNNVLISGCMSTVIPNTVTAIGKRAFEGIETLTEIVIPNSVTSIAENAFYRTCMESLHIPSSVTTIGNQAFGNCYKLKTITFEKWPENVGSHIVFYGFNSLEKVIVFDKKPTAIGNDTFHNNYDGTWTAATLYVPAGTKALYEATDGWKNFKNIVEMEDLEPVDEGKDVNFAEGGDITEETDLTGTIVNNMYYNIGTDAGGYNSGDGCIVITKETSDEQMAALEGLGITDEELKQNFTGIIFKVPAGSGKVAVTAETTGNMTLKVKVGNNEPWEMELSGKLKMTVPYNVTEETMVYIFAGTTEHNAARGLQQAGVEPSLRIYGISVESNETGLVGVKALSESVDVYSLDGRLVRKSATSLDGLPEGVYIINGRKVVK